MVPTVSFNLLYVLVIVRLAQRELVWIHVTAHPTAEWIAQQITEALPWNEIPRYPSCDWDGTYGVAVTRRPSDAQPVSQASRKRNFEL